MRGLESVKGRTLDQFIAAVITDWFDTELMREWTTHLSTKFDASLLTIDAVLEFCRRRELSMPNEDSSITPLKASRPKAPPHQPPAQTGRPATPATVIRVATSQCPICTLDEHGLARCPKFLAADASSRHKMVKDARRCTNCLGTHSWSQCQYSFTSRTCNKRHHTSLHRDNAEQRKTMALVAASK